MGLFFRLFQHLLPDSIAWRILKRNTQWQIGDGSYIGEPGLQIGGVAGGRTIERFFDALADALPANIKAAADDAYLDLFPSTTRELELWEEQFELMPAPSDDDRRAALAAAWKSTGGQSPAYIQGVLQEAGFNVYIHEWWDPDALPTVTVRNPNDYTTLPLMGTTRCGDPASRCGNPASRCNRAVSNQPGYLVNSRLSLEAPPPIPTSDHQDLWRYFLYFGGEVFPQSAEVLESRRTEFQRLLLKLCPAHLWIVTLVDYVPE